jgi:hypothetical protein
MPDSGQLSRETQKLLMRNGRSTAEGTSDLLDINANCFLSLITLYTELFFRQWEFVRTFRACELLRGGAQTIGKA